MRSGILAFANTIPTTLHASRISGLSEHGVASFSGTFTIMRIGSHTSRGLFHQNAYVRCQVESCEYRCWTAPRDDLHRKPSYLDDNEAPFQVIALALIFILLLSDDGEVDDALWRQRRKFSPSQRIEWQVSLLTDADEHEASHDREESMCHRPCVHCELMFKHTCFSDEKCDSTFICLCYVACINPLLHYAHRSSLRSNQCKAA